MGTGPDGRVVAASIDKTAFCVDGGGLYHWTRMPQGVTNGPAEFCRYVQSTTRDLDDIESYFDDIIGSSQTWGEHLTLLEKLFARLLDAGLSVKASKTQIGFDSVQFLGHVLSDGKIAPNPEKLDAIKMMPVPRSKAEVQSFLGLCGYYRKHIPHFADLAQPLFALTAGGKKAAEWNWDEKAQVAWERLRDALQSPTVLYAPDYDRPFILQCDASAIGIGAVLSQEFADGEHPVAFFSRQLGTAERNYHTTHRELLAIRDGVKNFRIFLLDQPFTIYTDHSALVGILKRKEISDARTMRMVNYLMEFRFVLKYRTGRANANADGMSRFPRPGSAPHDVESRTSQSLTASSIVSRMIDTVLPTTAGFLKYVVANPVTFANPPVPQFDSAIRPQPFSIIGLRVRRPQDGDEHFGGAPNGRKPGDDTPVDPCSALRSCIEFIAQSPAFLEWSNVQEGNAELHAYLRQLHLLGTMMGYRMGHIATGEHEVRALLPLIRRIFSINSLRIHDSVLGSRSSPIVNGTFDLQRIEDVADRTWFKERYVEEIIRNTLNSHYLSFTQFKEIMEQLRRRATGILRAVTAGDTRASPIVIAADIGTLQQFVNETTAVSNEPRPEIRLNHFDDRNFREGLFEAFASPVRADPAAAASSSSDSSSSPELLESDQLFEDAAFPDALLGEKGHDEMRRLQVEEWPAIIGFLENKSLPQKLTPTEIKAFTRHAQQFVLHDGLLWYLRFPKSVQSKRALDPLAVSRVLCLPRNYRIDVLRVLHDNPIAGGHLGVDRVFNRVFARYFWEGMYDDVSNYVRSCLSCQTQKKSTHAQPVPAMAMEVASYPFERVCVDILGPLPESPSGYTHIVIFVDYFSRWAIARPLKSREGELDAKTVARVLLDDVVCKHGRPQFLLSDRGSNFMSKLVLELLVMMGISKLNTTSYHPQTNGLVERFNGTIMSMLRSIVDVASQDWAEYVQMVVFAYNTSIQVTLQESPFFILHGRDPVLPGDTVLQHRDLLYGSTDEYINLLQDRLSVAWQNTILHLNEARDAYLKRNTNLKYIPTYQPGDLVWLLLPSMVLKNNKKGKFVHPWTGPCVVKKKRSLVTYWVYRKGGSPDKAQLVNVSRLKPLVPRPGETEELIFNQPALTDLRSEHADEFRSLLTPPKREPAVESKEADAAMEEKKEADANSESSVPESSTMTDDVTPQTRKRKAAEPTDRRSRTMNRGWRPVYPNENAAVAAEKRLRKKGPKRRQPNTIGRVHSIMSVSASTRPHDRQIQVVQLQSPIDPVVATSALDPNFDIITVHPLHSDSHRASLLRAAESIPSTNSIMRLIFPYSSDNYWTPRTFSKRFTNLFPIPFFHVPLHSSCIPSTSPSDFKCFSNTYITSHFPFAVDHTPYRLSSSP